MRAVSDLYNIAIFFICAASKEHNASMDSRRECGVVNDADRTRHRIDETQQQHQ